MVLEVVSDGSVRKDTVVLRRAYWEAGVREYWLVDARRDPPSFDILRSTSKAFRAARKNWPCPTATTKSPLSDVRRR